MFRLLRQFASRKRTPRDLALEAIARGRNDEARRHLNDLLAQAPDPAERAFLLNKRGVTWAADGDAESARADFEAALDVRPRYAPAIANLGNLAMECGDVQSAIERYEAAILADDGYAVAHFNLGIAYKRAGRLDDGVRAMRKAQRLEGRVNRGQSRLP